MAASKRDSGGRKSSRRPATTAAARENQLITAAVDLAEKQIRNGTATSQVITHYLKLGSTREALEKERLRNENELLRAKVESLASQGRIEQLYEQAVAAMRKYAGNPETDEAHDD